MTVLLPQKLPPQTAQLGSVDNAGNVHIDINWYLFLYNLASQVLPNAQGTPASASDFIDMVDLDGATSDILQAYHQISNLQAMQPDLIGLVDIQQIQRQVENVQLLIPDDGITQTQEIINALIAGFDNLLPDPTPQAQPIQAVTVGASPFTYTASRNGVLLVSTIATTSIFITRQGTSVDSGSILGPIPLRRGDSAVITYPGGAPTVKFLPD